MNIPTRTVLAAVAGMAVGVCGSVVFSRLAARTQRVTTPKELSPFESQQRLLALFEKERRDPSWADNATSDIREWFERATKRNLSATLEGVECRMTTCVVKLRWNQPTEIKREVSQLLQIDGASFSGCTSQLYVDDKNGSPYQAPLILTNCRR